ncbi:MAG: L-threonylcarbamoyladenylate synthase [Phycisphaerales bacterium]|nr:L-threonylcarbamoyladenylate synthase [Phycisphaerales bacterium]
MTHADPRIDLDRAVQLLRTGAVVAFPTETVYGLGALALDPAAVARVFTTKGRPAHNPLIVHVDSIDMAKALVRKWPDTAERLARAFWPGPLTLVLPRAPIVPDLVTAGGNTVALRCPSHPLALELLHTLNAPLVGPSANPSGSVSPTTAQHIIDSFAGSVPVLDGGPCTRGIESTVLDLSTDPPAILRPGSVSADDLDRVLAPARVTPFHARSASPTSHDAAPLRSPGLLARHYAPHAPARLATRDEIAEALAREHPIAAITLAPLDAPPAASSPAHIIALSRDPAAYAARLYAALREADAHDPTAILIEPVPDDPAWDAVRDRLARACTPA